MGEMISKPDANPIVIALLNWCLLGCVGYFMIGQSKKGIFSLIYSIVTCGFFVLVAAYDGYKIGEKLQSGQSVGETETALEFLAFLPGFDKPE